MVSNYTRFRVLITERVDKQVGRMSYISHCNQIVRSLDATSQDPTRVIGGLCDVHALAFRMPR